MRIISGSKRGKKLIALEGLATRPTSDRVKEALFDILQFSIEGKSFLDAFAGSGQIGIEALSRGAASAELVDSSPAALEVVRKNLANAGFADRARVVREDVLRFLERGGRSYDVIFLDPPYRSGLLRQALPLAAGRLSPEGFLICEHPKDEELPESVGGLAKRKDYRYGKIVLTLYRAEP